MDNVTPRRKKPAAGRDDAKYLTVGQAAHRTGMSTDHVVGLCNRNVLEHVRKGPLGLRMILRESLERYVARRNAGFLGERV
jgi:excisionase family DNA binding protein